jgi:predicted unusual protein kinase regulating ubiquinone biosynthesis (AarF/ABC1/UbiB family)
LENVETLKIADIAALINVGIDPKEVANVLLEAYFKQVFQEGFFHADPHPGNLFVMPMGPESRRSGSASRPFRLVFVDFGMVGHIELLVGENLRRMLVAITQRDARGLTDAFNDLGFFLPGSDLDRIAEAQERVMDQLWGRNLMELNRPDPQEMQELTHEFRDLLFEFPFQVPQDFIFLGRAMGMLSGLTTLLDPNINPWQLVEKYGRELISSQEGRELSIKTLTEYLRLFITLPPQAGRVLTAAESGRLRVRMIPDRALLRRLDRIERRVSRPNWSVLAAAMAVSGTLLYLNGETAPAAVAGILAVVFFLLMLIR